ncbi:hypothetical protein GOBAR_AA31633 [Gossypium barbadense]|uniref:SWIM-type domain-containing protein n=1 Tax=Gossypium barbadense TaxID=3634 RepID=A0A2P5WD93_GOSBA|nr:hypothetical protein GOBAR_AA31633 [Gossypium barbadense]
MTSLVSMREAAEKYPGPLCPRIQKKLSEIVNQSNNVWQVYAGNEKYEVNCGLGNKYVVDLLNSSCSCRKWDFSGIPRPIQWEHARDMELILPPMIRRPLGRPKQTRRKEVDEARKSGPKLSKTGQQANYTKCGKTGHLQRYFRGNPNGKPVIEPTNFEPSHFNG